MKIVASLIILGLCANVCYGATVAATSQSGAMSSSLLNSTATKVYSAANQTDAAIWNAYALTTPGTTGVPSGNVLFGPGTANTTSYVYGITTASSKLDKIYKRTLNATIVGWGNDTVMASVTKTDDTITSTTPAATHASAVGPGYLAILSQGDDSSTPANKQVYLNLVTGTSATQTALTTTADVTTTCTGTVTHTNTATTYGVGNIWYDIGSAAFFYTYWKAVTSTPCTSGTAGTATYAYTVWLGGHYTNGTAYWTVPGISVAATGSTSTNPINNLMGGGDNWLNATNIYIVYKDGVATTNAVLVSKTVKATTTTAVGSFGTLVSDVTTTDAAKTYTPLSVWASNYTYGVAVACKNQTAAAVWNYPIWNFLNGTTTATDSGLAYTSVTDTNGGATSFAAWPLTTGYTAVGAWKTATTTPAQTYAYQFGTFYANGTVNTTAATLATLTGPVSYYNDVNGTMWVGWTDVDTGNSMTYAGYLAKLQGQINVASGANVLTTILAFVALFLASIFAF